MPQRRNQRLGCAAESRPLFRRGGDRFLARFDCLRRLIGILQAVGAIESLIRDGELLAAHQTCAVAKKLLELRNAGAAEVPKRDGFGFRIDDH